MKTAILPILTLSLIGAFASPDPATAQAPPASTSDRMYIQSLTLRFQIIEADGFTQTDPAIADVQEALGDLFRFQGYRLAGETVIRAGGGGFNQQVAAADGRIFQLSAMTTSISPASDQGIVVRTAPRPDADARDLCGTVACLRPRGDTWSSGGSAQFHIADLALWIADTPILQTSFSIPVTPFGQTVVVGSAKPSTDSPTLILVVRNVGP